MKKIIERMNMSAIEEQRKLGLTTVSGKDKDKDGERARKKKRKEEDVDDESMWVEKPAPEAAKALEQMRPEDAASNGNDASPNPSSRAGRKRAIDFL